MKKIAIVNRPFANIGEYVDKIAAVWSSLKNGEIVPITYNMEVPIEFLVKNLFPPQHKECQYSSPHMHLDLFKQIMDNNPSALLDMVGDLLFRANEQISSEKLDKKLFLVYNVNNKTHVEHLKQLGFEIVVFETPFNLRQETFEEIFEMETGEAREYYNDVINYTDMDHTMYDEELFETPQYTTTSNAAEIALKIVLSLIET